MLARITSKLVKGKQMKSIQVQVKSVYGEEKVYPVCDAAKTFAKIAGTKTLTREVLAHISNLGYGIDAVAYGDHDLTRGMSGSPTFVHTI